jgi:hypothetical protein
MQCEWMLIGAGPIALRSAGMIVPDTLDREHSARILQIDLVGADRMNCAAFAA